MLIDAGPLIAVIDANDEVHQSCSEVFQASAETFITTYPILSEALFVLGTRQGWFAQDRLWKMLEREIVVLKDLSDVALKRSQALMEKYQSLPMDFGDATLVALAEELDDVRIFTIDSGFQIYRAFGRRTFEIIP